MLFDELYPNVAALDEPCVFDSTKILKTPVKGLCVCCRNQQTDWLDVKFRVPVCSEECCRLMWSEFEKETGDEVTQWAMQTFQQEIANEIAEMQSSVDKTKDIIIVVHDQLPYLKTTIESVRKHTQNYHLYIWDKNSKEDTQLYLHELTYELGDKIDVITSDVNVGFIQPNNELVAWGKGEYIILLNSDVEVYAGWDRAMLGILQHHPEVKLVGCQGGLIDSEGIGGRRSFGYNIDYVSGSCLCLERKTYEQYGLFNPRMKFAYAEDSDLSLRLQSAGHKIYALHTKLAHHFENKTIYAVRDEGCFDLTKTFRENHALLAEEWKDYLATKRMDTKNRCRVEDILGE